MKTKNTDKSSKKNYRKSQTKIYRKHKVKSYRLPFVEGSFPLNHSSLSFEISGHTYHLIENTKKGNHQPEYILSYKGQHISGAFLQSGKNEHYVLRIDDYKLSDERPVYYYDMIVKGDEIEIKLSGIKGVRK
jgi:hypothetical protein